MKNLSLSAKLYFVIFFLIITTIGTNLIGLNKLAELNDSTHNVTNILYKRISYLNEITKNQLTLALRVRDLVLTTDHEAQKKISVEMANLKTEVEKSLSEFESIATENGKLKADEFKINFSEWFKQVDELHKFLEQDKAKEAFDFSKAVLAPLRKKMAASLDELIDFNESRMSAASVQAEQDYTHARNQIFSIAGIAILLSIALAYFVINNLNLSIQKIIARLNENTEKVSSASSQIAASSEELSQATSEQAASLQETSSSIEEINSMINSNSENAKRSSQISAQSLSTAEKGKTVVENMIHSIAEINVSNDGIVKQIDETNKEIANIVNIISEIGTKTKVINDIVFQTKLLSFNASVEAARAGEQGKGFAVVAEEVGNLAAMSGKAALEITEMLDESIKEVKRIVFQSNEKILPLMSAGKQKVDMGTRVAHECGDVLNEIVSSVASVSKMVSDISDASSEQAQGVHEITKAIAQLDQVTQENTANSAESANAASALSYEADSLSLVVEDLILAIDGRKVERKVQRKVETKRTPKKISSKIQHDDDERFLDVV